MFGPQSRVRSLCAAGEENGLGGDNDHRLAAGPEELRCQAVVWGSVITPSRLRRSTIDGGLPPTAALASKLGGTSRYFQDEAIQDADQSLLLWQTFHRSGNLGDRDQDVAQQSHLYPTHISKPE